MPKNRILVVDDNEDDRVLINWLLHKNHYENVIMAGSKEEALSMAKEQKPDLIIMDVMLGHQSGAEVNNDLKNNPETKDIPLIFCSGLLDSEEVVKKGADILVGKSVRNDSLLKQIQEILG